MTPPPSVVIDPNVYVSAAISPTGRCGKLIGLVDDEVVISHSCPGLLSELHRALLRPKLRRYISVDDALAYCETIRIRTERHPDPSVVPKSTRDREDDYLVALALEARAEAIISGDPDLQEAELTIEVWSPRHALDLLSGGDRDQG